MNTKRGRPLVTKQGQKKPHLEDLDTVQKDRSEFWATLSLELDSLISTEEPLITALSNAAALFYNALPNINWCGFYLYDGSRLVLGPFGGKPACTIIPMGKGVCGTAASTRKVIRVADVDKFPGHIACDAASRSEIVIPLVLQSDATEGGELFGVFDIDSPVVDRFSEADERELTHAVGRLMAKVDRIKAADVGPIIAG